ncbi:hypothetical protein Pelo_1734 [Pelomyxa schiedti]|nr:hypothetical protein Pelo_1734 [Pelomyxa schiedti]
MAPMEVLWKPQTAFTQALKSSLCTGIERALSTVDIVVAPNAFDSTEPHHFHCTVDPNPSMHGYWGPGANVATFSHQSVSLGIPAVQLEIPAAVRNSLKTKNTSALHSVATAVYNAYEQVVIPMWGMVPPYTTSPPASPSTVVFNNDVSFDDVLTSLPPYPKL